MLTRTISADKDLDGIEHFHKALPRGDEPETVDFRSGYFEQLVAALREQLRTVDWEAARPARPSDVPKVPGAIYEQLDALSKQDLGLARGPVGGTLPAPRPRRSAGRWIRCMTVRRQLRTRSRPQPTWLGRWPARPLQILQLGSGSLVLLRPR